jgi:LPS sulfotransferase NodH
MGSEVKMTKSAIDTIVIVGTQRSGTTWLMQVLNQEPRFNVFGEVFREIRLPQFRGDPALKPDMFFLDYKDLNSNATTLDYVENVLAEDNKVTVFKIMYDQIRRNSGLFSLLKSKNVLVLNVERYNIFDIALSKCLARRTGVFHAEGDLEIPSFKLEYNKIYTMLVKEKIKQVICPPIVKFSSTNYGYFLYEDLLQDFSPLVRELSNRLGIENLELNPSDTKWKKTSKSNKNKAILNYDEITNRLSKSLFKKYIK